MPISFVITTSLHVCSLSKSPLRRHSTVKSFCHRMSRPLNLLQSKRGVNFKNHLIRRALQMHKVLLQWWLL